MKDNNLQFIRNFCIIAHIDHGKSTLADRLLELTETVSAREMKDQLLDQMELEREKGITIKLQPATMKYITPQNKEYLLNLIDTPGHVDFSYEVSRSLAACEGAILLVDATQGIQAQTLANLYMAIEQDLEILPVINKIDLPNANVDKTINEIVEVLGCKPEDILKISAKVGLGVKDVLAQIVKKIPAPKSRNDKFTSLIFDSYYDEFRGVVASIRVFGGRLKKGEKIKFVSTGKEIEALALGIYKPKMVDIDELNDGEVGYIVSGLKDVSDCKVGDTLASKYVDEPLPGYVDVKPTVYASFYPIDASEYPELKEGLEKLKLNDASLYFEPESSGALGRGFRCGFLGLLHLEIIQERLSREYDMEVVITTPSVLYKVELKDGKSINVYTPSELPDQNYVQEIKEPWAKVDIITPADYIGGIMELMQNYRGIYKNTEYLSSEKEKSRAILHYEAPLAALIVDFYDKLKSVSSGYASMNYDLLEYRASDLVRLDILVAKDMVDAFARIIPKEEVNREGKRLVKKLKDIIPKQNFQVSLQAAIGGKVIARENISAYKKDVTAKLYGGDVTRKRKLLEKQKKGKKKMKEIGKVEIPQKAFLEILKK